MNHQPNTPASLNEAVAGPMDPLSEAIILAGRHGVPVKGFGDDAEMRYFAGKLAGLIEEVRAPQWRCFHCDECFTDSNVARDHFGRTEYARPACQIDASEYRAMEARMLAHNAEDAEIHRQWHGKMSEHNLALVRAEERGYSQGLADAKKHPEELGLTAATGAAIDAREQEAITRDQIKVAIMERRGKLGRAMTTDDFADAIFELIGGAA